MPPLLPISYLCHHKKKSEYQSTSPTGNRCQPIRKFLSTHKHTQSTILTVSFHREKRDLAQLSALGHFLKGSSATLGLTKVKDSCEKIQHFGAHKDETGTRDEPSDDKCLEKLKATIAQAKEEFREVEKALRRFYHDE